MNPFRRKKSPPPVAPALSRFDRERVARPGGDGGPDLVGMGRDPVVRAALAVKRRGVIAAPWRLEGDPARCAFVEDAFARMEGSPLTIVDGALDALVHGLSVGEIEWREDGDRLLIGAIRARDPNAFGLRLDAGGGIEGLVHRSPEDGRERDVARERFLVWRHEPGWDAPRGRSDLDAARPHWRAKGELTESWKLHLARFGSPTMLGAYDDAASETDVARIFDALRNAERHKAIVHPDLVKISSVGGDRDGSQGFLEAIEYHNREIARSILGQTLATDEGRRTGSLAMGKVHFQVMLLLLAALRREVADGVMTEGVIRPLVEANFGVGAEVPRFVFEEPPLSAFWLGSGEL